MTPEPMSAERRAEIEERASVDLVVESGYLCERTTEHTCGAGPGSGYGCESGCGLIPTVRVVGSDAEYLAEYVIGLTRDARDLLAEVDRLAATLRQLTEPARAVVEAMAKALLTEPRSSLHDHARAALAAGVAAAGGGA